MSLSLVLKRPPVPALRTAAATAKRTFSTPVDDSFSPISATSPPSAASQGALWHAVNARAPRYDWTKDEIRELYNTPLMELAHQSVWLTRCTHEYRVHLTDGTAVGCYP